MAKPKWIWGQQSNNANGTQKDQQQASSQQQQQQQQQSPAGSKSTSTALVSTAETKKYGFENFGNTCYANSVMQALYHCTPFRELLMQTSDLSLSQDTLSPLPNNNHNTTKPSPPTAPSTSSPTPTAPTTPSRRDSKRRPTSSSDGNNHTTSTSSTNGSSTQHSIGSSTLKPAVNGSGSGLTSSSTTTAQTTATAPAPTPIPSVPPSTLFSALRSLFLNIATQMTDKGTVAPRAFIDKLKESNVEFRSTMHQDAHEFFNYLLNSIVEEVEEQNRKVAQNGGVANGNGNATEDLSGSIVTVSSKTPPTIGTSASNSGAHTIDATFVHKLFEGVLTSETRCLTCENVSSRDESFLDLSIDIEQNSSVTACLRQFSASEMLCAKNKFFCDGCCDLQEAEKRMKIKKLPNVLALHLKRFKYQEDLQRYIKLTYRVAFPFELKLFNTVDDLENADRLYSLFGIVVHIGHGPHQGHYVSIIKTQGTWTLFDDDAVSQISEADISKYFGDSNAGSAYVLFYQAVDIDMVSLGLRPPTPQPSKTPAATPTTDHVHRSPNAVPVASPTTATPTTASNTSSPLLPAASNTIVDDQRIGPTLPPGLGGTEGGGGEGETSDHLADPTLPNSTSTAQAGVHANGQTTSLTGERNQQSGLVNSGSEPPVTPAPISIKVSGWNGTLAVDGSGRNTTSNSTVPSTPTTSSTPSIPLQIPARSGSPSPTSPSSAAAPSSVISGSSVATATVTTTPNGKASKGLFGLRSKMPSLVAGVKSTSTAAGAVMTGLTTSSKTNRMSANNLQAQMGLQGQTQSVGSTGSGPAGSSPVPILTVSEDDLGSSVASEEREREKDKEKEKSADKKEGGKEKEKEKPPKAPERKPSSWFGNRSFKLGERNKDKEKEKDKQFGDPPPSPGFSNHARGQTTSGASDEPTSLPPNAGHTSWFKTTTGALTRRRPSDGGTVFRDLVSGKGSKAAPSTSTTTTSATIDGVHSNHDMISGHDPHHRPSVSPTPPASSRRVFRNSHSRSQSYSSSTYDHRPPSPPPPLPTSKPPVLSEESLAESHPEGFGLEVPHATISGRHSTSSTHLDQQKSQAESSGPHGSSPVPDDPFSAPTPVHTNGTQNGHDDGSHGKSNAFVLVDEPGEMADSEHISSPLSSLPTSPSSPAPPSSSTIMSPTTNGLGTWTGNHSVASSSNVTSHSGGSGAGVITSITESTTAIAANAASATTNGSSNGGYSLKKATRKLSLTAPRLGFVGKRDKERR